MAGVNLQVIVLNARRAKGTIENNGKSYEFTKFYAIDGKVEDDNCQGFNVVEYKGDYDLYSKIEVVPGKYLLDGSWDGKRMSILDIEYISPVEVKS